MRAIDKIRIGKKLGTIDGSVLNILMDAVLSALGIE